VLTTSDALIRSRQTAAHRLAVICGGQTVDHATLAQRCERVVGALAALGLRPGDRVAVLAADCHRYVELYFGVPAADLVLVPLNIRLAPAELAGIVRAARPGLLVVDRDPGVLAAEVERVLTFEEWDAVVAHSADGELGAGVTEDDLAVIYFTSGTTGRPKGVMLTHRNLVANSFHKTIACRLQPTDVFLASGPFFHVAGTAPVLSLVWLGGSLVVLPGFDAAACLDAIEEYRVTVYMPVPTMLAALAEEQRARLRDVTSLRLIGHAGSAITTTVIRDAHETFPDAELDQYYGATETASIVTCLAHEERLLDGGPLGSVGQPVVGVAVEVLDATDRLCNTGSVGEVVVRGPNVTVGYWEDADATAAAFVDGWYRTGDVGYLDEERNLWLLDRAKDMIVTGGENVYSIEVEEVLARHPAVVECAVFAVPDERWVEAVHALVVVNDPGQISDALVEELRDRCRASIAGFKVPKRIELRTEPLPKSGPGKVLKRQLRAAYWVSRGKAEPFRSS
jgi:long-chain acyl-CoA synthetase